MQLLSLERGDDEKFIGEVEIVVCNLLARYTFVEFYLIRVDNWFDHKWCGHPRWAHRIDRMPYELAIPPFHPHRVVSQNYFRREDSGAHFSSKGTGQPIHRGETDDSPRRAADAAPLAALFWISGCSGRNTRACLMAYLPADAGHWPWYVGYVLKSGWQPCFFENISREEFRLISAGASHSPNDRPGLCGLGGDSKLT